MDANITAHESVLICQDAILRGTIWFEPGCIVHPRASIIASSGKIAFGNDCVIEEGAEIIYHEDGVMQIGEGNIFMVGCHIESPSIGNFNTFQPRSRAPPTLQITDYCTLSAGTTLGPSKPTSRDDEMDIEGDDTGSETLEPYTVIYGGDSERRKWDGKNLEAEQNLRIKHLQYLREILPKFNRMRDAGMREMAQKLPRPG